MSASAPVYNDFSGLAQLRYQAKQDPSAARAQVVKQFESLFTQMMVKQMRQAGFGGGVFDSERTRFYQEMYDQQLSLHLAEQGGMGMEQVLRRQLGAEPAVSAASLSGLEPYWRAPVRGVSPTAPARGEALAREELTASAGKALPESGQCGIESPADFVCRLWPCAEAAAEQLGLPPEALLAQAALESGWGSHVMTHANGGSSHNLFGIKAGQGWDGGRVKRETLEYESGVAVRRREPFRAYDSFEQSFSDYVAFVKGSPRYAQALQAAGDPETYFRSLQEAGYATDPAYADKILRVMQGADMQAAVARLKASAHQSI